MKLSTLFVGGRAGPSLGRVAFWLVFGIACYKWIVGQDILPGHETILIYILCYNLGGKVVSAYSGRKVKIEPPKEQ
jgi:hypothetical protein